MCVRVCQGVMNQDMHSDQEMQYNQPHLALWILHPSNFLLLCQSFPMFLFCLQESRTLPLQGQLLGRMVPRCSDPLADVRQTAVECIQLTLRIACSVPGNRSMLAGLLQSKATCESSSVLAYSTKQHHFPNCPYTHTMGKLIPVCVRCLVSYGTKWQSDYRPVVLFHCYQ